MMPTQLVNEDLASAWAMSKVVGRSETNSVNIAGVR